MNTLATFIKHKRASRSILLMTHVIYGYPTIDDSLKMMKILLDKGVAILEVQFPFSDPVADGPIITNACHSALEHSPKLEQCLKDVNKLACEYPDTKVLLMSYLNPVLQYGFGKLAQDMSGAMAGIIIPDLPIDQHHMLKSFAIEKGDETVNPVWLIIPNMQVDRIKLVCSKAQGLLYCVSRAGVTGQGDESASVQAQLQSYLDEIKQYTEVPLALGFGIASAQDIEKIVGMVDVAVVGSALIKAYQANGFSGFSDKVDELLTVA